MQLTNNMDARPSSFSLIAVAIGLLMLSLAVRLPGLDLFLTSDEPRWIERTHAFMWGLVDETHACPPDRQGRQIETSGWGCTFQTAHPGIITMWSGTAGIVLNYFAQDNPEISQASLAHYLINLPVEPVGRELIRPVRLPTVIITSLFVALFFLLAAYLLNWPVAFIAALLLALDPFHAALSRILHHDALVTTFMTLSLLMMLGYYWRGWSLFWLITSGLMAGLAILSKMSAIFLLPYLLFCGLLATYWHQNASNLSAWLKIAWNCALWLAAALFMFVLLFPAMWVIPLEVASNLFLSSRNIVESGHTHLFLGELTNNPGWLFYPLQLLLRLSPLSLVGLVGAVLAVGYKLVGSPSQGRFGRQTAGIWLGIAAYIFFFLIFLGLIDKKIDRYLLPIWPLLNLIAAAGLLWLGRLVLQPLQKSKSNLWATGLIALLVLVVQGNIIRIHAPYYSTYYSPLFGGPPGAANLVSIAGWGEGQEQAAAYLNQKGQAEMLQVVNWQHETFSPYFKGESKDYSFTNGNVMSAPYVVVPVRQIESQEINPTFLAYLQHIQPEQRITLQGVDYVYIYPLPVQQPVRWKDNQIENKVTFFGYRHQPNAIRLYWQQDGLRPGEQWWLALPAEHDDRIEWLQCQLDPAFVPERETREAILESVCPLPDPLPPPGVYHLRLAVGPNTENLTRLPLPEGEAAILIDAAHAVSTPK